MHKVLCTNWCERLNVSLVLCFLSLETPNISFRLSCRVYEVGPLPNNSEIRPIAQLDFPQSIVVNYSIWTTDRYVIVRGMNTLIWDYSGHRYTFRPSQYGHVRDVS